MTEMSKLQIRAKVLSVISEIKSLKCFDESKLSEFTQSLEQISDKTALFDIFIKEYIKMEEKDYTFSACLLKNLVESEYINEKVFDYLKSNTFSDEIKYKLVQLLRIVCGNCNFNELPAYFEKPEEVLDMETKKLLENAMFNPESMLDFLDFVSAVSTKDRNILLESLKLDYTGDVLANIIYPVLYSDFDEDFILRTVEILGESKSSLAIEPFNYLLRVSANKDIIEACRIGLKKLKLAGASLEKADEYYKGIIKNSSPAEFFTTIPDGSGNQAFLISRAGNDDKFSLAAVVVNDIDGIVDCFGFFAVSRGELVKIVDKFYKSEGKYRVNPQFVKTKIQEAMDLTISLKKSFPYEFICWNILLKDINILDYDISDFINKVCKQQLVSRDVVLDLLTRDYTLRWFMTPDDNEVIKELTVDFYSADNPDIEYINGKIKENKEKIFDKKNTDIWIKRMYNMIYLLLSDNNKKEADIFYTILKNEDYFKTFKLILIQRSMFCYFTGLKENIKESLFTTNIFRKNNSCETEYDIKKINNLINIMKRNWIDG